MVSFVMQNFLVWCIPTYLFFLVLAVSDQKKIIAQTKVKKCFFPVFFSMSFTVAGLMFKLLISFEFIFIYGVR